MIAQALTGWEMYGPAGLIVATLLGAFGYLYRDKVARERELDDKHYRERKEWAESCKAERTEILTVHAKAWEESRQDTKVVMQENIRAVNALEKAVIDLHIDVKARRLAEEKE